MNYQAFQHSIGCAEISIEQPDSGLGLILKKELYKFFEENVTLEINDGKPLHQMNGKLIDFVTMIGLIKN